MSVASQRTIRVKIDFLSWDCPTYDLWSLV